MIEGGRRTEGNLGCILPMGKMPGAPWLCFAARCTLQAEELALLPGCAASHALVGTRTPQLLPLDSVLALWWVLLTH